MTAPVFVQLDLINTACGFRQFCFPFFLFVIYLRNNHFGKENDMKSARYFLLCYNLGGVEAELTCTTCPIKNKFKTECVFNVELSGSAD